MNSVSHHSLLFAGIFLGCLIITGICSAGTVSTITTVHPYLLFTNIAQTPGYQYQTLSPWKTWNTEILDAANGYLNYNFSGNLGAYDRICYRGEFAEYLGLEYQISKNPKYAAESENALKNMSVGTVGDSADYASALGGYAFAYDWVQPTLDHASDIQIRDNLATLANKVYQTTNTNGTTKNYVDFPDLQGHLYPALGIASAVLGDYTNPNNLPLNSSPSDWYHAGTDYLFVNDQLHSFGVSLFSQEYDPSGKDLLGAYKMYTVDDLSQWYQVCNSSFGINLMSTYPVAEKAFTSETWESMPNEYSNNFVTNGNILWTYQMGTISLMTPQDKATVLNHLNLVAADSVLPKSITINEISTELLYCVYGNYNSITPAYPAVTSHMDPSGVLQVIRSNWNTTSDWLSFTTWNNAADSNRNMMHNDQLGFEYYSRGDLLLADAGEPKHILDYNYGTEDIDHNVIAVDNPRTPFTISPWSGSASAGLKKGTINNLITPASIGAMFQLPWMQLIQSNVTATEVTSGAANPQKLTSPIQWQRTMLYPESDYFIVVDRMQGTEVWGYSSIFRPSSLMVTPSSGSQDPNVGHDNVSLSVGSTPYNWQSLPYRNETDTGIATDSLTWQTTNPYGKAVTAHLVTSPTSEVLIGKNDGRIGGYDTASEVYTPVVYMKPANADSVFRVTALLANYPTETAKTGSEIVVNGIGHAINVHAPSYDDYIYTGTGTSSFGAFSTNADTAYVRSSSGSISDFTLLNGSYLTLSGSPVVTISNNVGYITAHESGNTLTFQTNGQGNANIVLGGISATSVTRDGVLYSNWANQNGPVLNISTDLGLHQYVINIGSSLTISPVGTVNAIVSIPISFPVNTTYTGKGTLNYTAANLPANATFNSGTHIFAWTPSSTQTGAYNITFSVTDGTLSAITVATIVVSVPNTLTINPVGTVNAIVGTPISFPVNTTYTGKGTLNYTAANLPANATFNSGTHIFAWTPSSTQTGVYNITFSVTDGTLSASTVATIVVTPSDPPAVGSISMEPVYDGDIWNYKSTVNSTFSNLTAGSANHVDHNTYSFARLQSQPTSASNTFYTLFATAWTFNTSSIPQGSTITKANLSLYLVQKGTGLGQTNYVITPFSPANTRNYGTSDWQRFGTRILGTAPSAAWQQGSYYNISLSPSAINVTGGDTTLAGLLSWQQGGAFAGTWVAGTNTGYETSTSTAAANQPMLYVYYTR